ncbi:MAG TPA: serine/threonine-protein kinase [Candidatus Sulfotelmatobacter sp.]|nr:serine/threonine-protein kinase [Candidatus Sulfotelmatobacter sp.]
MSKNRYEVIGNLGCGATSRVDKARDTVLGRTVALKTLVHSFGAPTEQKQFLREAQIVSQLSHPAIVNLYDVGVEDGNVAYLVMEYVPGKTLQQVLSESTGPMPIPRACAWISDLAGALHRAHRSGVIHGDIKPANILVTDDGKVKLSDFGIARFATQVSGSGRMMGTPAYLSPEQILGEPQNTRSDLFSLGIVLYQMVTGFAPFDGSSVSAVCAQILQAEPVPPSQRNPAVSPELDRIILRCLAKTSADRYPSAEAFATSLDAFVRHGGGTGAAGGAVAATVAAGAGAAGATGAAAAGVNGNSSDTRKRGNSWLARPLQPSDAWFAAALAAAVLCSVPVTRAMRARYQMPPAPVVASGIPHAPNDLTGETQYTEVPDDEMADVTPSTVKLAKQRAKAITRGAEAHAVLPAAKNGSTMTAVSAPVMPLPLTAMPISRPIEKATLKIEIDSSVGDGALAIFADQTLLYTTDLKANEPAVPVKLEQTLPPGPHQLRVALYRADKSLQMAKEGLGEMRTDSANLLRIHVSKKAKMLVKHENSLDVAWPSAMGPAPISAANYAGSSKK